jgi:hypothetical protein
MKSINYLVLFVFALTITISSCKKDESTKSSKEIMTSKSWKVSSSKTDGVAEVIEDCQKDDILTFASSGTYTYNVGANTCNADETTYDGSWSLSADGKTLTVDGETAAVVITENQIKVTLTIDSSIWEMIYIPV